MDLILVKHKLLENLKNSNSQIWFNEDTITFQNCIDTTSKLKKENLIFTGPKKKIQNIKDLNKLLLSFSLSEVLPSRIELSQIINNNIQWGYLEFYNWLNRGDIICTYKNTTKYHFGKSELEVLRLLLYSDDKIAQISFKERENMYSISREQIPYFISDSKKKVFK